MKINIKHILFGFITLIMFLPIMQEGFSLSKIRDLSGDYVPANDVAFTRYGWTSKKFQEQKEKYLHDHFGYHHTLIRLHNEIAFRLFKKAKANGVVIGKQNYLYEDRYIDAYYGTDFIGIDSAYKKMKIIQAVADTLKSKNKTFLLVFAPGKAAYYPEYIPNHKKAPKGITNHEVFIRFAKELSVPHIDFHSWFIKNKSTSPHPLIPKYGIHWTQYGAIMATDSILKTVEQMKGEDIPGITWKDIKKDIAKDTDIDIEKGMNLLFRLKPEQMSYPEVFFNDTIGKTKPNVLVIGDSFYWQIFAMGISDLFNCSDFWYYFKTAHNPAYEKTKKIQDLNIIEEINRHDVIIVMSTDVHLPNLGWNFFETIFGYYNGTVPAYFLDPKYYQKIKETMDYIRSDKAWFANIEKKAEQQKIPVDSMLYIDAEWCVVEQYRKESKK